MTPSEWTSVMGESRSREAELLASLAGRLGDSCGAAETPRCDADGALEVMRQLALIRGADAGRDLGQRQRAVRAEQLLDALDAARDHVLVWSEPGRCLELPREVVGAQVSSGGHLLEARCLAEMVLDVLDDGAELGSRQGAVAPPSEPRARDE